MLRRIAALLITALVLEMAWELFWPLPLPQTPYSYDLRVGLTLHQVAQELEARNILRSPRGFVWLGRLLGRQTQIQAGSYEWEQPLNSWQLLQRLTAGAAQSYAARISAGMTLEQVRRNLTQIPALRTVTAELSSTQLMRLVGFPDLPAEGEFFPDTYFFNPGSTDLKILKRAAFAMQHRLQAAWEHRSPTIPWENPYQALIVASLIEKETARAEERPLIAGVFINRLRLGMRLQTDPTVIYGMGSNYHGVIHRSDLLRDTPYNTYTRPGLPPTPIALPGQAAIEAALHPDPTSALYFVARGDGSHTFSTTLAQHNQAVSNYRARAPHEILGHSSSTGPESGSNSRKLKPELSP